MEKEKVIQKVTKVIQNLILQENLFEFNAFLHENIVNLKAQACLLLLTGIFHLFPKKQSQKKTNKFEVREKVLFLAICLFYIFVTVEGLSLYFKTKQVSHFKDLIKFCLSFIFTLIYLTVILIGLALSPILWKLVIKFGLIAGSLFVYEKIPCFSTFLFIIFSAAVVFIESIRNYIAKLFLRLSIASQFILKNIIVFLSLSLITNFLQALFIFCISQIFIQKNVYSHLTLYFFHFYFSILLITRYFSLFNKQLTLFLYSDSKLKISNLENSFKNLKKITISISSLSLISSFGDFILILCSNFKIDIFNLFDNVTYQTVFGSFFNLNGLFKTFLTNDISYIKKQISSSSDNSKIIYIQLFAESVFLSLIFNLIMLLFAILFFILNMDQKIFLMSYDDIPSIFGRVFNCQSIFSYLMCFFTLISFLRFLEVIFTIEHVKEAEENVQTVQKRLL